MDAFSRELPNNLEAERALLGSVLLDSERLDEVLDILGDEPGAFWLEKHAKLWETLMRLRKDSASGFDSVVLKSAIEKHEFDALGGYDFLASLIETVPSSLRAVEYAALVHEAHLRRMTISAGHRMISEAFDDRKSVEDVTANAAKSLDVIIGRTATAEPEPLAKILENQIELLEHGTTDLIPSPFLAYNEIVGGFAPGELVIIAGRPSLGKTALAINFFLHLALHENIPCCLFSLEQTRAQIMKRCLAHVCDINSAHLRKRSLTDIEWTNLRQFNGRLKNPNLYIDDSVIGASEICNRAKALHRKRDVRAVFIDYLQEIRSQRQRNTTRDEEVGGMTRDFKALAKNLGIPVILLAQLNRKVEDRIDKRPRMSDLRDSGSIEQAADVIGLLADHLDAHEIEERKQRLDRNRETGDDSVPRVEIIRNSPVIRTLLIIEKNRDGEKGEFPLWFNMPWCQFTEGQPVELTAPTDIREPLGQQGILESTWR